MCLDYVQRPWSQSFLGYRDTRRPPNQHQIGKNVRKTENRKIDEFDSFSNWILFFENIINVSIVRFYRVKFPEKHLRTVPICTNYHFEVTHASHRQIFIRSKISDIIMV